MSSRDTTELGEQLGGLKLHGQDGTGSQRSYIPRQRLETFWASRNINAILRTYHVNKSVIFPSFLCTFSLLIYINKISFLKWFIENNVKDSTFPLGDHYPPSWPDTPPYIELFPIITEWQWMFFPVTFEQRKLYNQVFDHRYIFPIHNQESIKDGDTIQVHKIEMNPPCDPVTFVRKTYFESAKAQYERELKTFSSLQSRSSPHIISYHGCYQQQRLDRTITYNLILGFVEGGNLEQFFTTTAPPHLPSDINKIWHAFVGALEGLHHLNFAAIDTNLQTIHQDIKPDNLLISKPASSLSYDIQLVIADFGYSTQARRTSQDTWGIDSHGGQVYGAPESSHHADYTRHGRTHITPKVDIWSLGCVMSETAVWIKFGLQGLEEYRNRRIAETRTLRRFDQAGHGGCFHDGSQALSAVQTAHNWIRDSSPHEIVTPQVLQMIETYMLVSQGDRQEAQFLCERLFNIIEAASSGHEYNSPPAGSAPARSLPASSPLASSPPANSLLLAGSPPTSPPLAGSPLASPPPTISLPRIQTHPAPLGPPWTPLMRGRSHTTIIDATPAPPWSPISTSRVDYSTPLSPEAELPGSQPNGARHPRVFNTSTMAPQPDAQRPLTPSPILTFDQAREWYKHSKNSSCPVDPRVEDVVGQLGNNVKGRDHIFFVDVSRSMSLHFQEIKEKFQILAYLAKQFDPDGVEVCFSSEVPVIHKGDTSKLLNLFNEQKWDQLSFEDRIGTFIDQIVIPRLSSLRQKLGMKLGLKKPKNLTIFVLTDGQWGEGKEGAAGVENPIWRLINVIRTKRLSRTQVAIQFLRFGNDPDGKRYLTFLDHYGTEYKCDCVDTKPIDGNIFDMFIGPINADIDTVDEVEA